MSDGDEGEGGPAPHLDAAPGRSRVAVRGEAREVWGTTRSVSLRVPVWVADLTRAAAERSEITNGRVARRMQKRPPSLGDRLDVDVSRDLEPHGVAQSQRDCVHARTVPAGRAVPLDTAGSFAR